MWWEWEWAWPFSSSSGRAATLLLLWWACREETEAEAVGVTGRRAGQDISRSRVITKTAKLESLEEQIKRRNSVNVLSMLQGHDGCFR